MAITVTESIRVSDSFQAVAEHEGHVVAFMETQQPSFTRHASVEPDGSIRLVLQGMPPRNEDDSEVVLDHLLTHLRGLGGHFTSLGRGSGDDDFLVSDDSQARFGVQVVRAFADPSFWRELAHGDHRVERNLSPAEAAQIVARAIWHKAHPGGIPMIQRANMILALDAVRLPALTINAVCNLVPQCEPLAGESLGFHATYIVGPVPGLVRRLQLS